MNKSVRSRSVQCPNHPTYDVTHYCCLEGCLTPLCPKCIKQHNNLHKEENTFPEIEHLDDVKQFCEEKLKGANNAYQDELQKLLRMNGNKNFVYDEEFGKIQRAKQMALDVVISYFDELEDNFRKRLSQEKMNTAPNDMQSLQQMIQNKLIHFEKIYNNLEGIDMLNCIKIILEADIEEELYKLDLEINRIFSQTQDQHIYKIVFDENRLKHLYDELQNYACMSKSSNISPRTPIQPSKTNSQNTSQLYQQQPQLQSQSRNSPGKDNSNNVRFGGGQTFGNTDIKKDEYYNEIDVPDYFDKYCTKKFLHFFQHKNKVVNGIAQFDKIELNIPFKIPRWHRSITTPTGDIYMIGGVDVENADIKLKACYMFNFISNSLVAKGPMIFGRSGHGICFLNNYIYAIGGFSEDHDFTNRCERYDILANQWQEIAPLNFKANNPCACTFRNKYIYKFGGKIDDNLLNHKIERYNPQLDIWTIIEPKIKDSYLDISKLIISSMAAISINQNQIFVFGGTFEDYSIKNIDEDDMMVKQEIAKNKLYIGYHGIRVNDKKFLPFSEGFWNNTPILNERTIFCLQNVQNEKNNNIVYLDRRRILRYKSNEWMALN